jgi:hypothetical protein
MLIALNVPADPAAIMSKAAKRYITGGEFMEGAEWTANRKSR